MEKNSRLARIALLNTAVTVFRKPLSGLVTYWQEIPGPVPGFFFSSKIMQHKF